MKVPLRTRARLLDAVRSIQYTAELTLPQHADEQRPVTIGVTSPNAGEGKTTIAMALASSLSGDVGAEVALVDADFRTHSIELEYGLMGRPGFSDALQGSTTAEMVEHRVPNTKLSVVTAGQDMRDAERIVHSGSAATLLDDIKGRYRYIVLDLPSALTSPSASVMGRLCDGVIVVVRCGHTTTNELDRALGQLQGSNVLGAVLNRWQTSVPRWLERSLALRR